MKTVIYLVRHGEVHNPDRIMYERLPGFLLSDRGRIQAHTLGKHLSTRLLAAVYTSPLERARETADIIASYHNNVMVIHDERLLEVSTGARGMHVTHLERDHWNFYSPKYRKYHDEKMSDIWNRMRRAIRDIVKKHKGQEVVVVSHGDPLMISIAKHKGRPLRRPEIRGEEYVQTARGFRIVFEDFRATEVSKLEF